MSEKCSMCFCVKCLLATLPWRRGQENTALTMFIRRSQETVRHTYLERNTFEKPIKWQNNYKTADDTCLGYIVHGILFSLEFIFPFVPFAIHEFCIRAFGTNHFK